jgi:hypothetical protein
VGQSHEDGRIGAITLLYYVNRPLHFTIGMQHIAYSLFTLQNRSGYVQIACFQIEINGILVAFGLLHGEIISLQLPHIKEGRKNINFSNPSASLAEHNLY